MDLDAIGNKLKQFGSDIANGVSGAFDDAVSGAKSLLSPSPIPNAPQQPKVTPQSLVQIGGGQNQAIANIQQQNQQQQSQQQAPVKVATQKPQLGPVQSAQGPVPTIGGKNVAQLQKADQGGIKGAMGLGQAGKDLYNNSVLPPLLVNSLKGSFKAAEAARQQTQSLIHGQGETNQQLLNQQQGISQADMAGVGGAAAVPAYGVASALGGKQKNADLSAINVNPKAGVAGQLLTVGGEALNSTAPLGLADLPGIMEAVKAGAAPDAAELLTSKAPESAPEPAPQPTPEPAPAETQEPLVGQTRLPGSRNMDAERAAIEEAQSSGSFDQAVIRYAQTAGVDEMSAMQQVIPALREAGVMPASDSADSLADLKPIETPSGTPPKTAQAAKDLADSYLSRADAGKSGEELVAKAKGKEAEFSRRGDNLEKAMQAELTPEERQAVRDNLEGVAKPEERTPKVEAVTQVMRQLNEMGYNVLDRTQKTGMARVRAYATRLSNFAGRGGEGATVTDKIKNLFDVSSRFAKHRQVGKFLSEDGEVRYGTQGDAGLKRGENGELVSKGKVFKPQAVSTRELNEHGYNYEGDYGKIANVYHSSVGRSKARYDALQEILRNPEKYGVHEADVAAQGDVPITKIPELEDMYAKPSLAKKLGEAFGAPEQRNIVERIWQGMVHSVVQPIILNPWFHGRNLNELAGMAAGKFKGVFGAAQLKKAYVDLAKMSVEDREALATRLFRAGGGLETYGAKDRSAISNALDAVGMPHINKANAAAMAKIDETIRFSLFHLLTKDGKVTDEDAAHTIDEFMGDRQAGGQISRNVGLFWNYFRTRARVAGAIVTHPVKNAGAAAVFAEQAAVLYGVTKAFQAWTGNKHASLGHPGLFGLVNQANELRHGQFGAVVSSELNPVITAGINQATHTDMYSGKDISNDRLGNAATTLFSPSQYTNKVSSGKASIGQEATQFLTGASLPHVKGAPAAPNFQSGPLSVLNTKGASAAPNEDNISDKTGIAQANSYYSAVAKGQKVFGSNDQQSLGTYQKWLSRNHDPATGNTIMLSPSESKASWSDIASDPKALAGVQAMEKAQPNHNPIYDLPLSQLKVYAQYESIADGDPNRTVLEQKNPWLTGAFATEQQWSAKQIYSGTAEKPPGYVAYPTVTPGQNQMMSQVSQLSAIQNRTPAQEQQLTTLEDNPDLQAAFTLMDNYTNARRKSEGLAAIPYPAQNLTPTQESLLQQESALPSGTGAKTAFIKANQDQWNQVEQILAQNTLYDVEKQGAIVNQGGTSDTLLKDVYNAGKYDIAAPAAGGNPAYTLNPSLAYTQSSSSSGGSSSKSFPLIALPKRPKVSKGRKSGKPRMMRYHPAKLRKGAPKIQSNGVLKKAVVARPTAVVSLK